MFVNVLFSLLINVMYRIVFYFIVVFLQLIGLFRSQVIFFLYGGVLLIFVLVEWMLLSCMFFEKIDSQVVVLKLKNLQMVFYGVGFFFLICLFYYIVVINNIILYYVFIKVRLVFDSVIDYVRFILFYILILYISSN